MLKRFRYIFLPLSIIYGMAIWIRNKLFDLNILKSASFNFPIICVGNLATGGTGKTPMTEYLADLLRKRYKTATLSRGYKRKTKGFAIANDKTTAIEIGDEPMQFHQKFPDVTVAVGEERLVAIPQILHQRPETRVIILDDAFQHRTVIAGMNLLLTECKNLYTRDMMLPAGNLRDLPSSRKRANIIIVTKCKASDITSAVKEDLIREIDPLPGQKVFFTEIVYSTPYHLFHKTPLALTDLHDVLLLCGIANPSHIEDHLKSAAKSFEMICYPDHHIFASEDLKELKKKFEHIASSNKLIVTTEKDAVRLEKFRSQLEEYPIYVLPMKHHFLFNEESIFNDLIFGFVESFKPAV